jgi:large subunit ribosomal protein L7/L12
MADENTNTDAPVVSEESIKEAPQPESAKEAAEVIEKAEDKKESKAVSKDLEGIIEKIEKLSVLELADLVHALEDKFGVTAAAPMAMAAGPAAGAAAGEPAEEKTSFNVVLTSAGANKIGAIKAVRELVPTLGLKEAKDLVESAPKPVLEGVNKATADEAKAKLTEAGATVELQ